MITALLEYVPAFGEFRRYTSLDARSDRSPCRAARCAIRAGDPRAHQPFQLPRSMGGRCGCRVAQEVVATLGYADRPSPDRVHRHLHVDVASVRDIWRPERPATIDRTRRGGLECGDRAGGIRPRLRIPLHGAVGGGGLASPRIAGAPPPPCPPLPLRDHGRGPRR